MRLLGMPDGVISSVARNGSPRSTITITAPSSGAVTILNVRPGMSVSTGQTLAEITGLNPIWLEAAVPEILAGDVRVGQPLSATLTAFPGGSEEHTSELQSLMRISYAVFCLKKKKHTLNAKNNN